MNIKNLLFVGFFMQMLCSLFAENQPIDLSLYEKKIYSQDGEDGIIEKIFECIGTTNKFFVEFGVENGAECNTRYLREHLGWNGLMMDGSNENLSMNLQREFITAENINALFAKYHVPKNFDLLSIDIDYNDFYVWNAIKHYSPRVVVIEYNATHLPNEDKVCKYDPNLRWDGTNYYGASILSLAKLGKIKGYTLVYADNIAVNLFFIRDDILAKVSFVNAGNVNKIYKFPSYGKGPNGGHSQDPRLRKFVTFKEARHKAAIWRKKHSKS